MILQVVTRDPLNGLLESPFPMGRISLTQAELIAAQFFLEADGCSTAPCSATQTFFVNLLGSLSCLTTSVDHLDHPPKTKKNMTGVTGV